MSSAAPQTPQKLVGTKWTAVEPKKRRKHWEVVSYSTKSGEARLRAVIDGHSIEIAWRNLRDRDQWLVGWV